MSDKQIKRFSGDWGNRWYLGDKPLFAGQVLEALMANGEWARCRFETGSGTPLLYDILTVPVPAANVTLRFPHDDSEPPEATDG